jgi:hypothetical protein
MITYNRLLRRAREEEARELHPVPGNAPLRMYFMPHEEQWYFCGKCDVRQQRKEFEVTTIGAVRLHQWCRSCRKKHPQPISDYYARRCVQQGTKIPMNAVPAHLIELKRRQIQLKRMVRENH